MKNLLKLISIVTILGGVIVTFYFLNELSNNYQINSTNPILMPETGQVGDFIGGVVGTIFSLAGFFMLLLTLSEQTKFAKTERFESKFFDLLKLHRENVKEMGSNELSGRKEFHNIFLQFLECREELKPVFKRKTLNNIYESEYLTELENKFSKTNKNIDLVKLAKLNIPYLVVFYGVGSVGKQIILDILENKYKKVFVENALDYIAMKPIKESDYFKKWEEIQKKEFKHRTKITRLIKRIRNKEKIVDNELLDISKKLSYSSNYTKFYGGHQYKLGHYFRHLFQTFTFINQQNGINFSDKYFYAKTLRAQLSTHEQFLLFLNSISTLGLVWDLTPEVNNSLFDFNLEKKLNNKRLISKYNIIKNIPGKEIYGIKFREYYPKVEYEFKK